MGGLMARAAGALSNCEKARGSAVRCGWGAGVTTPGASSMAEWQIPQAEQAPVWWLCPPQAPVLSEAPWQAMTWVPSWSACPWSWSWSLP